MTVSTARLMTSACVSSSPAIPDTPRDLEELIPLFENLKEGQLHGFLEEELFELKGHYFDKWNFEDGSDETWENLQLAEQLHDQLRNPPTSFYTYATGISVASPTTATIPAATTIGGSYPTGAAATKQRASTKSVTISGWLSRWFRS